VTIWLPEDNQSYLSVEWYTSGGSASGVNSVTEQFARHTVGPPRSVGFDPYSPYRPGDLIYDGPPKDGK